VASSTVRSDSPWSPTTNILTVDRDGNIVETAPAGDQVAHCWLDDVGSPLGAGALFGIALALGKQGAYFVDDNSNTLNLLCRRHH